LAKTFSKTLGEYKKHIARTWPYPLLLGNAHTKYNSWAIFSHVNCVKSFEYQLYEVQYTSKVTERYNNLELCRKLVV
jgi:hypothetical protein